MDVPDIHALEVSLSMPADTMSLPGAQICTHVP